MCYTNGKMGGTKEGIRDWELGIGREEWGDAGL